MVCLRIAFKNSLQSFLKITLCLRSQIYGEDVEWNFDDMKFNLRMKWNRSMSYSQLFSPTCILSFFSMIVTHMEFFLKYSLIFTYYLKHYKKNNWKHLEFVLKNNLLSKQILKKRLFFCQKFAKHVFWFRKLFFFVLKNKKPVLKNLNFCTLKRRTA